MLAQQSVASSWAVSTIRRTSSSTSRWVASEVSLTPGSSGLMPSSGITAIGPIARLMPQRPTMWRAIRVSCWMSDSAPGGQIAEHDLLGHAAAERDLDLGRAGDARRS